MTLHDPFNRAQLPPAFSREQRMAMIVKAMRTLLNDSSPEAQFTAGGVLSWLSEGGDLVRDYWRVAGRAGSHRTPAALWRELSSSGGATGCDADDNLDSMDTFEVEK